MDGGALVKGPWSEDEDEKLLSYIRKFGHGHWETLARKAGLNRTGKSCRLRWLNYLRPGVCLGNITLREQLIILQLHSRWGNRWAKIAECLPGRSDNEIKNYWRTRVQKQAKQLQCHVNSYQFREIVHHVWIPQLAERVGQTQFESSPIMTIEKLSSRSKSQSQLEDATEPSRPSQPIPSQLSHQPSLGYSNFNEDDMDTYNLDATLLGVGVIDCSTYADLSCKKMIPCKDCPMRKQGVLEAENDATVAWFDQDIFSLENLWNDDEMGQTLLYDDDS